jgi:hypothetical protein
MTRPATAALGLRVKSGWATAVLVVGPARSPRVVDRRVIELSDPAVPSSRQPYHAVMGATRRVAPIVERRLRQLVQRVTRRSVAGLLRDYRRAGHQVCAVGLVVGSTIDPTTIANEHIRAHALEGQLFRTALVNAAGSLRLPCTVVVEREAFATASGRLKRPPAGLKRAVGELGRALGGPWRAEEKTAAIAAWMILTRR